MSEQTDIEKNSPSPDLFSMLGKILSSMPSDTQANPPPSTPAINTSPLSTEPSKAGGDMLSSLLSNPEVIAKLPQIMSMLGPLMGNMTQPPPATKSTEAPKSNDAVPASLVKHHKSGCDNRSALLYAMKPYLKRERQEAIDYMVKLSKLGDILKNL